jgi:hypothetical protein
MAGCRDCSRCTESAFTTMIMGLWRLIFFICGGFLVRAVQKTCPQCGHPLRWHARRADGSFRD